MPKGLTKLDYDRLRLWRWKARTDLGWLCRNVLGYPDVSDDNGGPWHSLHQPMIDRLQKFPSPTPEQFEENDILANGQWIYTPIKPMLDLEGKRRRLLLDSRSFLKTTINCISHSIQWIINYPDIAMLLLMASDKRASDVLSEIKGHFQYNPRFRDLFPDHCPKKGVSDWGTMAEFTSEARPKQIVRKEPTIMTGSVDKGAAGYHFHVIKFSDIVDENNVLGDGLSRIRKKFDISLNLLINPRYWLDVEGTRYHFGDTYGKIIEREAERVLAGKEPEYVFFVRGALIRDIPGGEQFVPSEGKMPFKKDPKGRRISRWPENFSIEALEDEEKNDPWLFACQKINYPVSGIEGATPFPVNKDFPKKISRKVYNNVVRVAYKEICIDLAETDNPRSNYTCITVGTIATDGRLYIEEIHWGRFLADVVVDKLFLIALKHYKHLKCIKIEKSNYLRGLQPTIQRVLDTVYRPKGIDFTIQEIQRGNRTTKADRIHKMLQPWYKNDDLRFVMDQDDEGNEIVTPAWIRLVKEMEEFPSCETDDILDTLADFLMDKEYFGREVGRANPEVLKRNKAGFIEDGPGVQRIFNAVQREAWDKFLRIEDPYKQDLLGNTENATTGFFTNPGNH